MVVVVVVVVVDVVVVVVVVVVLVVVVVVVHPSQLFAYDSSSRIQSHEFFAITNFLRLKFNYVIVSITKLVLRNNPALKILR